MFLTAALSSILIVGSVAASNEPPSGSYGQLSGTFVKNSGTQVDLVEQRAPSGDAGSTWVPRHSQSDDRSGLGPVNYTNATPVQRVGDLSNQVDCGLAMCLDPAQPLDPGAPTVTAADIASFRPDPSELSSEPTGVGIVGLPANILTGTRAHVVAGTLFDVPAQVRFTPARHLFTYGDGSSRTTVSAGSTWAALGVPQFTPTATSHVYGARGEYTITLETSYAAEATFDGVTWIPVDGLVTPEATTAPIQVLEARTALVGQTCVENPRAAGC
jgi:hypothetical protein